MINLSILVRKKQYGLLFLGQTVSFFGSMMTYVAVPYQIYLLTKSSFMVGLLGSIQLIPLIFAGLYGGALADTMDRRRLLLGSEILLTLTSIIFVLNCFLPVPSVLLLFIISALASVFVGFHRPAMEAITPQLVDKSDLATVASLSSLRYAIGAVAAPALGGWLIATHGLAWTYGIDALTYFISLTSLWMMKPTETPKSEDKAGWKSIKNGFTYAISQPVICGTYLVDIIAMLFAMPMALYPALAESWGGAKAAGWLYASLPMGAMIVTVLFSSLVAKLDRQGAGVTISALTWGIFIAFLAYATNLYVASACLVLAGAADAVSAIYRQTIWNEMIPNHYRGRLAGLNMLSYMIGPLIGNARAGFVASMTSNFTSILSGGIMCIFGCIAMIWFLPDFWQHRRNLIVK